MNKPWRIETTPRPGMSPIRYVVDVNGGRLYADEIVASYNVILEERDYLRSVVMKLAEGKVIEHEKKEDCSAEESQSETPAL